MDFQIDQAKLQQAFDLAQQRKETQEQIAEDRNDVNIYRINTQASLKESNARSCLNRCSNHSSKYGI